MWQKLSMYDVETCLYVAQTCMYVLEICMCPCVVQRHAVQRHGRTYEVSGDQDPTLQCLELGHGGEAVLLLSTATDVC